MLGEARVEYFLTLSARRHIYIYIYLFIRICFAFTSAFARPASQVGIGLLVGFSVSREGGGTITKGVDRRALRALGHRLPWRPLVQHLFMDFLGFGVVLGVCPVTARRHL